MAKMPITSATVPAPIPGPMYKKEDVMSIYVFHKDIEDYHNAFNDHVRYKKPPQPIRKEAATPSR